MGVSTGLKTTNRDDTRPRREGLEGGLAPMLALGPEPPAAKVGETPPCGRTASTASLVQVACSNLNARRQRGQRAVIPLGMSLLSPRAGVPPPRAGVPRFVLLARLAVAGRWGLAPRAAVGVTDAVDPPAASLRSSRGRLAGGDERGRRSSSGGCATFGLTKRTVRSITRSTVLGEVSRPTILC